MRPTGFTAPSGRARRAAELSGRRAELVEAAGGSTAALPRIPRRKREAGDGTGAGAAAGWPGPEALPAPPPARKRVRFAPEPPRASVPGAPPRAAVELVDSLNAEQAAALRRIVLGGGAGSAFFVDGPAGVGKSHLLRAIRAVLEARGRRVLVAAWSGLAARSVEGSTFASLFQLGRGRGVPEVYELARRADERSPADSPWRADDLLVEEISCLPGPALDTVDHVARAVRGEPGAPFGGMRVVFFGDFFQLPPTAEGEWCADSDRLLSGSERYAFESEAWRLLAPERVTLSTPMRHADPALVRALLSAREGRLAGDPAAVALFRGRVGAPGIPDRETRLYGSNARVDRVNDEAVAALPGPGRAYRAVEALSESNPRAARAIADRMRVPRRVELRAGARVLFTANLPSNPLVRNGVSGRVVGFEPAMGGCGVDGPLGDEWRRANGAAAAAVPIVELDDGERVRVHPFAHEVEGRVVRRGGAARRESLGAVAQLPLRLAHAVTITRAQGLSFDGVRVPIDRRNAFLPGMAYVALSRCRSLEGLVLEGFDPAAVTADPRVVAFYARSRSGRI